jgi:beta-hydroxylase
MKWIVLTGWIAAILFAHFRGRVRLPLGRQLLDHSIILAPINALMVLNSRVPTTPYIPNDTMPELKLLEDNWEVIRDEALHLNHLQQI